MGHNGTGQVIGESRGDDWVGKYRLSEFIKSNITPIVEGRQKSPVHSCGRSRATYVAGVFISVGGIAAQSRSGATIACGHRTEQSRSVGSPARQKEAK